MAKKKKKTKKPKITKAFLKKNYSLSEIVDLKNLTVELGNEISIEAELSRATEFLKNGPQYVVSANRNLVLQQHFVFVYDFEVVLGRPCFKAITINDKTVSNQNLQVKTLINPLYYTQITKKEFNKKYFDFQQAIGKILSLETRDVIVEKTK